MRKSVFIVVALTLVVGLVGCGKKQQTLEEMQEPVSMDELSKLSAESETKAQATQAPDAAASVAQQAPAAAVSSVAATVAKPTNQEIQTALKNANFYAGEVDGKIGTVTKKAIEEFQKANNLKADGKVGAKTWALLSKYLVMIPAEVKPKQKR